MNIINEEFDDMVIIERLGIDKHKHRMVKVKCKICEREKITTYSTLREYNGTKHRSCGQYLKRIDTKFYNMWCDFRKRTTNPKSSVWKDYGGRGIKSEEFKYFIDFYDYFYNIYTEHLKTHTKKETTLDRIDCNGDYCKGNLRFVSQKEQNRNTRVFLTKDIKVTNVTTDEIKIYKCVVDIKENIEINLGYVYKILNKKVKTNIYKGYRFERIDKCVTNIGGIQVAIGETPLVKDQDLN